MEASLILRLPAHLDCDLLDREGEEWRSVVAYDGYYEVSSHGRIRSLARLDRRGRKVHPRILAQEFSRIPSVNLCIDRIRKNFSIMSLVADAFLGSKPEDHVWYHLTENNLDNRPGNITHGTWSTKTTHHYALGLIDPVRPDGSTIGDYQRENQRKHNELFGHFEDGVLVARVCTGCLVEKPIELFKQGSELRRKCQECLLKQGGVKDLGKRKLAEELAQRGLRRCNKCGQTKQLDNDFYPSKTAYLGHVNTCKTCCKEANDASKEYRKQRYLNLKAK